MGESPIGEMILSLEASVKRLQVELPRYEESLRIAEAAKKFSAVKVVKAQVTIRRQRLERLQKELASLQELASVAGAPVKAAG